MAFLPSTLWVRWLQLASAVVVLFGLSLIVFQALGLRFFSLLLYQDAQHLVSATGGLVPYLKLLHAVLGAVLVGWGVAMWILASTLFAQGKTIGWVALALHLLAWFLPDTLVSLLSGFWQNAALNAGFAFLFTPPLAATWRLFFRQRG